MQRRERAFMRDTRGSRTMTLGIQARLAAGFGAVLLLSAAVIGVGWKSTIDSSAGSRSLYQDVTMPTIQLAAARHALDELRVGATVYPDLDRSEKLRVRANELAWRNQVEENMKAYAATASATDGSDGVGGWDQAYQEFLQARTRTMALEDEGRSVEARTTWATTVEPTFARADSVLEKFLRAQEARGVQVQQALSAAADGSTRLLVGLAAMALLLGTVIAAF